MYRMRIFGGLVLRWLYMQAKQHSSPLVRAAAQACLSECAYPFRQQQPQHLQKHIWHLAWSACESDEAAPVKAGAAKCLANLTQCPNIQRHVEGKHWLPSNATRMFTTFPSPILLPVLLPVLLPWMCVAAQFSSAMEVCLECSATLCGIVRHSHTQHACGCMTCMWLA